MLWLAETLDPALPLVKPGDPPTLPIATTDRLLYKCCKKCANMLQIIAQWSRTGQNFPDPSLDHVKLIFIEHQPSPIMLGVSHQQFLLHQDRIAESVSKTGHNIPATRHMNWDETNSKCVIRNISLMTGTGHWDDNISIEFLEDLYNSRLLN